MSLPSTPTNPLITVHHQIRPFRPLHRTARASRRCSAPGQTISAHKRRQEASKSCESAHKSHCLFAVPSLLRPLRHHPRLPSAADQLMELLGGPIYAGGSLWSLERRPRLQPSTIYFVRHHHSTAELPTTWGGLYELEMS